MISPFLQKFMKKIQTGEVEVYNEFSLQHELGIYLRNALPNYKVEFERNVKFFQSLPYYHTSKPLGNLK